jgi:hypothetical protein
MPIPLQSRATNRNDPAWLRRVFSRSPQQRHHHSTMRNRAQPVDKKIQPRLTGPVNGGRFAVVICCAQNPSAGCAAGVLC